MKRLILLIIAVLECAAPASAEPSFGTTIGPDGDLLQFFCLPSEAGVRCEFVQVLMSPAANEDDLADQLAGIGSLMEELNSEGGEAWEETCVSLQPLFEIAELLFEGDFEQAQAVTLQDENQGEPAPELEEMWRTLSQAGPTELADSARQMALMADLCEEVTRDRVEALVRAQHELLSRTCRPFINTWESEFQQISDQVWTIVNHTPSGECGIVRLDRFECDETHPSLCNFISEKRVLNPDGDGLLGSCSNFDETEFVYEWNEGPRYLPCDRVEF